VTQCTDQGEVWGLRAHHRFTREIWWIPEDWRKGWWMVKWRKMEVIVEMNCCCCWDKDGTG